LLGVLVGHDFHTPALLAHVGRTLGHAVTLVGRLELDLAGRGQREALLGAALGLHLGHFASFGYGLLIGGLGMPYVRAVAAFPSALWQGTRGYSDWGPRKQERKQGLLMDKPPLGKFCQS